LFKNKFEEFINKYRAGKIDDKNNTIEEATQKDWWEKVKEDYGGWTAISLTGGLPLLAPLVVDSAKAVAKATYDYIDKKAKNAARALSYDKKPDEKVTGKGFKAGVKAVVKNIGKAISGGVRLMSWRREEAFGLKYGAVRDFMIDGGVLDMLERGKVNNTLAVALPLIAWLVKLKVIPKGSDADGATAMHHLMQAYFKWNHINGYDWSKFKNQIVEQSAFAQVFLEYLNFKVLPEWNKAETCLSDAITYHTKETKGGMYKQLAILHKLFTENSIMEFMSKYLRFPNMEVTVIDYSNVGAGPLGWVDKASLDKFRQARGIPTPEKKKEILTQWEKMAQGVNGLGITFLKMFIASLTKQLSVAQYEAKYTGDSSYANTLGEYLKFFTSALMKKQPKPAQESGTIVKGAANIATVDMPPRTQAEIEEEKRKKEAEERKKAEEEKRKRDEEERKRLEIEAKRREALKIAEAKIKAMEAIKEQERRYETILEKMVGDPGKVTDEELKSLGDDVKTLKQEAENRIAQLPREEREMKLALIRGDKISEKTFSEVKETAIGLHGNLQEYMDEVGKIPVGSVVAVNNPGGGGGP